MNIKNTRRSLAVLLVTALGLLPVHLDGETVTGHVKAPAAKTGDPTFPVVVWIEGAEGVGVPAIDTEITHAGGRLIPSVSVGYVGREFVLRNDDTEFHNTHLYLHLNYQEEASQRPLHYGATLYNIPQPLQGVEVRRPIKPYHRYREETGFIEVVCNRHPDERAFVLVFDHPYCAVVNGDDAFTIEGVPPGRYPLMAFANGAVRRVTEVEVLPGSPTSVTVDSD